jgi:hypothetical protein
VGTIFYRKFLNSDVEHNGQPYSGKFKSTRSGSTVMGISISPITIQQTISVMKNQKHNKPQSEPGPGQRNSGEESSGESNRDQRAEQKEDQPRMSRDKMSDPRRQPLGSNAESGEHDMDESMDREDDQEDRDQS